MRKIRLKKFSLGLLFLITVFIIDRLTKLYILNLAEVKNSMDIYVTSYLNLYLIWNKGIAFGLFSFNERFIYNIITAIILLVTAAILIMIIKNKGFKKYSLMFVLGGSLGNLFDRIYYSAVPDFIDFHINDFHWFVFNVADIFITLGIICLIFDEILINDKKNGKNI